MYEIVVYYGYRSVGQQAALYAQGRRPIHEVNGLRKSVGLPPISERENRIVTNARAGWSWHNYGLAVDFFPVKLDGKPDWSYHKNDPYDIYDEVVQVAQSIDYRVIWGNTFGDYGHIEWHPGLNIKRVLGLSIKEVSELIKP